MNASGSVEYKYLIVDGSGKPVVWEEGGNRVADLSGAKKGNTVIVSDEGFRYKDNWRGAGVAIPVFSLRSKSGFGVGEFPDIKLMVDWAKRVGLKLVQILPINDTVATHRWKDSYPYAGISVFALHPLYLNLHAIGTLSAKLTQDIIDTKGKELNLNDKVRGIGLRVRGVCLGVAFLRERGGGILVGAWLAGSVYYCGFFFLKAVLFPHFLPPSCYASVRRMHMPNLSGNPYLLSNADGLSLHAPSAPLCMALF